MVTATVIATISPVGCASQPKRDPDQSQIRYQLGVDQYNKRRVEAALSELNKSLEADPTNAEAHNLLGIIALNQGHDYVMQAETLGCLRGADAEAVRGDATKKFRAAEQSFRKAVELKPDFPMAANNLAVAALQLRDWDVAISAAQDALKDPTYGEPEVARANLGWAYFHKKDLHNAWKELHEAVSRAPGFCVGGYRLAKIYVERGDFEQAAEQVDAVTGNKQCPIQEAFLLAGLVQERRKDHEKARAMFGRCVDMAPRSCVADECRRYGELIQ